MNQYDLIIVGAGPAGITAGVYAARKGINFLIVTDDVGGQTLWSADVENYTGYQFITGAELVGKFEQHLKQFNVALKTDSPVQRILQGEQNLFSVQTKDAVFTAKSVMVASGRRPHLLSVLGEDLYRNKGLTYCATCDGPLFAQKTVAVVGGGNSALDAVLQLVNIAQKIYLININSQLGGDEIMRKKVEGSSKVEIFNNAQVREVAGSAFVEKIIFSQGQDTKELAVSGVFVEIGSVPNSEIIDFVEKNSKMEIKVDSLNRTSVSGVFAAGDVTDVPEKQIIVAAGEGAKAVLGVSRYLLKME
ncbi:MAG: FAD-dependent oxidoreductase [Candidatus Omnitrophota bacterium]